MTDQWPDEAEEWADDADDRVDLDLSIESEVESKVTETPYVESRTASLPDGTYLALSGAGAGSAVVDSSESDGSIRIPTRDEALASEFSTLLLVHRPHQAAGVTPRLFRFLAHARVRPVTNASAANIHTPPGTSSPNLSARSWANTENWDHSAACSAV
jgi:hypothetical protein